MERAGLQSELKAELMGFRLENSGVVVTNTKKIECIRSVLTTTEATANKVAGANASALISGAQTSANALAAAPAPVVKDKAKPHDATRTAAEAARRARAEPAAEAARLRQGQVQERLRVRGWPRPQLQPLREGPHWDPDCPSKPKREANARSPAQG
jgi:hypothetical protein